MTANVSEAAATLGQGKLVAFPTDTVWGLAADATNDNAVAEIFAAKGRPILKPLAVLLANAGEAEKLAVFNRPARALARKFWPGALTLVLRRRPSAAISALVTSGLATIGLRVPAHPLVLELLEACDTPLAVTSANPSGAASAISSEAVAKDLGDKVALILDGDPAPGGVESTVVAAEEDHLQILRLGAVSARALAETVDVPITGPDADPVAGPDSGESA
ncbi:MAG: threonylcarbamoyl-AMP synthase [Proteobacteria bacterium]|nr:threonylcarbamoyl-AMP synthase [Pseudomonadota bacterium]